MTFNQIWEEHRSNLLNFVLSKIDYKNSAEDILQEVGIKLLDNLNRKTEIKNYKSWLFQVTRNTIADYYRKNKKQAELLSFPMEANDINTTCVCDLSGFVIQNYLPKKYGEPLFLSDVEQRPQKEIATELKLSLTATKSRIQRGRKMLKEMVSECIHLSYNNKGQIVDFELKKDCELPKELKIEMQRLNLVP